MTNNAKKIIAREFLILLGSVILFFIIAIICSSIASSNEDKINTEIIKLKSELNNKESLDSLSFRLQTSYLIIGKYPEYKDDRLRLISKFKNNKDLSKYYYNLLEDKLINLSLPDF